MKWLRVVFNWLAYPFVWLIRAYVKRVVLSANPDAPYIAEVHLLQYATTMRRGNWKHYCQHNGTRAPSIDRQAIARSLYNSKLVVLFDYRFEITFGPTKTHVTMITGDKRQRQFTIYNIDFPGFIDAANLLCDFDAIRRAIMRSNLIKDEERA